jgi:transposase InsO family protein
MPFEPRSSVSLRREFVELARQEGACVRELCRRYAVSPTTAYKWLQRYAAVGAAGLQDKSRRPHTSPARSSGELEARVLGLRDEHPAWGARKLHAVLEREGLQVPAVSTVHAILKRHARIGLPGAARPAQPLQRFEHEAPNALWQMDFKGHFALGGEAGRCHPLTTLDDCSRFCLVLQACGDEKGTTVQGHLTGAFRRYGLPERMLMDNGSPWGSDAGHPFTPLTAWLIRLGIRVSHGRPYHPQTQGKEERFHRSLKAEVLAQPPPACLRRTQARFDTWREVYNCTRPHEALGMQVPAERYRPSSRTFPEVLPPIEYAPDDSVRRVQQEGWVSFRGRDVRVGRAFTGQPVALRPAPDADGLFDVFYCHQRIARVSLDA